MAQQTINAPTVQGGRGLPSNVDTSAEGGDSWSTAVAKLNAMFTELYGQDIGQTPGTVSASKSVVVDSNSDIKGFRNLGFTGLLSEGTQTGITAWTTRTQGGATALTKEISRIDTSTAPAAGTVLGDGVALMSATPPAGGNTGLTVIVWNNTANPVQLYGAGSDTVNGVAGATGIAMPPNSVYMCVSTVSGVWAIDGVGAGAAGGLPTNLAVNGLTAHAGGGQGSATALPAIFNRVATVASVGDSVLLPASAVGLFVQVSNAAAANAMDIFPATGDAIDALGANVAIRINAGTTVQFWCSVAGTWHMSPAPLPASKYTQNTASGATTAAVGDLTGAAFVTAEYTAVGAANLTTRTATQMFQDSGNIRAGASYMLMILNSSGGTTTLTAGSGVTINGTATLATNTGRIFNVKFPTATTCTITNIGGGIAK